MEDRVLKDYIRDNGEGKWSAVPKKAGQCTLTNLFYNVTDDIFGHKGSDCNEYRGGT